MNYLINDRVTYDSLNGKLYILNDGEVVRLSKTLNRLMLVFVQNSNKILDREQLLLSVWQGHNQVVSDNNLNSNISVLRRYLSSFFDEDMILTIPKIGFKFSAQVVVEEKINLEPQNLNNKKNLLINNKSKKKLWFFLGLTIFSIVFILGFVYIKHKNYSVSYPIVGKIDQCIVYYINDDYKLDVKSFSENTLKEKISYLGINCKLPAKVYYYVSSILMKDDDKGTLFLSYCPETSKNQPVMSCETFYEK